ncbi:hypothetical protein, partial [Klebsiella pneumoniae]|uniref:hypothetical protein n=1 Tax=Klebsiella pneumoniae TaxID=573 RepID=UPI00214D7631
TQPATGETYPKSDLFNKARLDQLFVKTQVKLAEHHQSFHVCFVLNANLAFYYQLFISLLISCNCDVS